MSIGKREAQAQSRPSRAELAELSDKRDKELVAHFPSGETLPFQGRVLQLYRIKKANLQFQWETIRRYYPKRWRFAFSDLVLGFASLFFNPYRVCRKNGFVYGETPPLSLGRIAAFCNLTPDDTWLELGSGRGKGCFWISHFIGCRTIGIEKVPLFYRLSSVLRWIFRMDRVCFIQADFNKAQFHEATCVYLYSTCMSEEDLEILAHQMKTLPIGAKVVTVSAPLPKTAHFSERGSFPLSFPWGDTEGYLHLRIPYLDS